eukprot:6492513-Amphidinium_carterae.1
MQHNARYNLDAQGRIAPTLASSRGQQHVLTLPDEPITASHAAQLTPTVLLHQSAALDSPMREESVSIHSKVPQRADDDWFHSRSHVLLALLPLLFRKMIHCISQVGNGRNAEINVDSHTFRRHEMEISSLESPFGGDLRVQLRIWASGG